MTPETVSPETQLPSAVPLEIAYTVKEVTRHYLTALGEVLTKAKTHIAETEAEEQAFLQARLYPDMQPMIWQVQMASEFCARCAARLTGQELPSFPFEEQSFDELLNRLELAIAYVSDIDDEALNYSGNKVLQIPFGAGVTLDLTGRDYILKLFLPNFFFHITTAYDLLRHNGVPLGKRDFVGKL